MTANDYTIVRDTVIGAMAAPEAGGTQLGTTSRISTHRSSVEPKTPPRQLCAIPGMSSSGLYGFSILGLVVSLDASDSSRSGRYSLFSNC